MRIVNHILFGVLLCFITVYIKANEDYKVENIPDSLKENAVAVIRSYSSVFTQQDVNNGSLKVHKVITVLNERGRGYADFYSYKDDFIDFKKFEGILRSGSGKEIKKIKKGDLIESSFSEHMAADTRNIFYSVNSPVYPYTVEYTYEQQFKGGIIGYPHFRPIMRGGEALEKANYTIEVPLDVEIRYLSNFDSNKIESENDKSKIYTFSCSGIKALKNEPLADISDKLPRVRIAPTDFCYDKECGDLSTWNSYGFWVNKLLVDRDQLSPDAENTIKELVKDAKTDREKVDILYKFLQKNTRYVSIQLGIGGWQPIPAQNTLENKYGDCKGLSNLMKAMLKVVGINSFYSEIYLGEKKEIFENFSDLLQTNHVILLVPLENDSIWLECTSSSLPMGYIHDDIAGHNAIAMTEKGGVFCTLPSYNSEQNLAESTVTINIAEDGTIDGHMKFVEHLHGFSNYHLMMKSNDRDRHVNYINGSVNFPKLNIGAINTTENLSELPFCTLEADFKADSYVTQTGQRMFIPIFPFKKGKYDVFKSRERVHDIVIGTGFSERDSVVINLPDGYVVESIPKNMLAITPYGSLIVTIEKLSDAQISCNSHIKINEGRYKATKYNEIKDFFQKIVAINKSKMVIKKEI